MTRNLRVTFSIFPDDKLKKRPEKRYDEEKLKIWYQLVDSE